MSDYDIIVAGAGHNGLTTAAYLAKAGLKVLALDGRELVGGDVASEELTLPGFLHDSCSTAHNVIQSNPMLRNDELGLLANGLEYVRPDPVVHLPFDDGASVTMWQDIEATCDNIARHSKADAAAYRQMIDEYDSIKAVFGEYQFTPIGWGPGLDQRLADHPDGPRWARIRHRSAADIIEERFENEHVRSAMLWIAFMTMQPPERLGTGRLAFSLMFGRQRNSWIVPKGGSGALADALAAALRLHGGEIATSATVTDLIVENGRCVGVELADGTTHRASRAVVSSIHLKHIVEMGPTEGWDGAYREAADSWRPGIAMFGAHYATTVAPIFDESGVTPLAAGLSVSVDRMLRLGSDFKNGIVATDDPPLLVLTPSVADPTRAPAGHHTLKVVGFHPYELPGGPQRWDDVKEDVAAANLDHLRRHASNVTDDTILAGVVKSPLDLERINPHNWHGSCHGGDQDPAQSGALRPALGWADHRTPIEGLYQTGATTHPGGSVSSGPGRNAAEVILSDLGLSFET